MNIDKSPQKIKNMFNKIASGYDFMNNIISFGTDKIIKFNCIKLLHIKDDMRVLDLCTGTGDIPNLIKGLHPNCQVVGVDFSEEMLKVAKKKLPQVKFVNADCTKLPFEDNFFDVITICYGLRNVENRESALKEIFRVLKPGGEFLHLDFGEKNWAGSLFETIVPVFAKFFGKDSKSYRYLIESKRDFPSPDKLIKELSDFKLKKRCDFLFKSVSCQILTK